MRLIQMSNYDYKQGRNFHRVLVWTRARYQQKPSQKMQNEEDLLKVFQLDLLN